MEAVPPPADWTPEWRHRMQTLDMSSHLNYLNRYELLHIKLGMSSSTRNMHEPLHTKSFNRK